MRIWRLKVEMVASSIRTLMMMVAAFVMMIMDLPSLPIRTLTVKHILANAMLRVRRVQGQLNMTEIHIRQLHPFSWTLLVEKVTVSAT